MDHNKGRDDNVKDFMNSQWWQDCRVECCLGHCEDISLSMFESKRTFARAPRKCTMWMRVGFMKF
jgi:hypothetical protein